LRTEILTPGVSMKLNWLIACALLVGCAHGKMGMVEHQLAHGALQKGETIYVEPISADAAAFSGDKAGDAQRVGEEKALIKSRFARQIADELRKKGFAAQAVTERPKSGVVLSGHVTRFEHGSAAARILVGMGAGSSNLYTDFELANVATKQVLSKFEVIATSGGNGGLQSAGGYIDAHLNDGAEKTAEYISESNGK
jgi:Domain of unknown function (DUF4410)